MVIFLYSVQDSTALGRANKCNVEFFGVFNNFEMWFLQNEVGLA